MLVEKKLKIIRDAPNKYHFKMKDNNHVDIEHKGRRLKFKLHKWDREASVEVFLDMVESDAHTFTENKIEIEDSKKKIRVFPIDTRSTGELYGDSDDMTQCHDGGLRYDIKYFEKPPTNFYDESLVCRNTRWSKQPFLTQKDIDAGVIRPLNVEGSYAVYHIKKKNNQYMTGKMLTRYRPIAIDALGNKAWCDMEVDRYIDPTNMRVTIPQQFLDEATYPVVVDPDFGYDTIGSSETYVAFLVKTDYDCWRSGSAWTMPAPGGTANWIKAYLRGGVGDTCDCTVFINQKDSGGAGTHAQIATDENIACAQAAHWEQFDLADEELTEAVVYILNIMGDPYTMVSEGHYFVAYDENGAEAVASYNEESIYDTPESPWVVAAEGTTRDYSLYCNYDEPAAEGSGGAGAVVMGTKSLILDLLLEGVI